MKNGHNLYESFAHGGKMFLLVEAESELRGLVLTKKVFSFKDLT